MYSKPVIVKQNENEVILMDKGRKRFTGELGMEPRWETDTDRRVS